MSKPDRHKYSGHYVCSLTSCLSDPHGLSTRRACLRVNTSDHKYCIPLIITPLAYPGRRRPRATQGKWGRFPSIFLGWEPRWNFRRAWEFLEPERLAPPGPGLGLAGGGGGRGGQRPDAARSAQYLLSCDAEGHRENPIWHAWKGFQLYLPPCKYPRVPDWGTLFCTEQYKYPICYNAGVLFLPKLFFSFGYSNSLYPLPLVKKKKKKSQMFTLLI